MGFLGGRGVKRDAGHWASCEACNRTTAATHPGSRFTPPEAGCFYPKASLPTFADALHRRSMRA